MLSAFIRSVLSYPAVPLARQLAHQRNVLPNPLVLKKNPRKFRTPTADRDRPVSRRSEPSSRTTFIGEQPNPWKLLHLRDVMSRHRISLSVISHCVQLVVHCVYHSRLQDLCHCISTSCIYIKFVGVFIFMNRGFKSKNSTKRLL